MDYETIDKIPTKELRLEMPEHAMAVKSIPSELGFKIVSWQRVEVDPTSRNLNQSQWTVTVELEGQVQTQDLKTHIGDRRFITVSSYKLSREGYRDIYLT